ncbi:MAG TPA: tagaturonate epimerase family protein [Bacteroidales bacterium]|nr:tagaturonate epimerase family protein [Bacteroidales bacterium]
MQLEKYSFGTGDRFGRQGLAQLNAIMEINRLGVPVVPVWNKSNREHTIIGSKPADVKAEAIAATGSYSGNYYIDADHINLETVDRFMESSNFFTIDVAHFIGKKPGKNAVEDFVARFGKYVGPLTIAGIDKDLGVSREFLGAVAENYLVAVDEVQRIYDHICSIKGRDNFVAEVSVDEAELVQGPLELLFILALLHEKGVELQTIAPKFSGLFAKGVDYIGNVNKFAAEFEQDVAVVRYAIDSLGLPETLKLSVHSGSDKFSIYPSIKTAIRKFDAGIHVKTAGTTWLEEVIGLCEAGKDGLGIAREIYAKSLERYDELTGPYTTVLHINRLMLPGAAEVNGWSGKQFSEALTHDQHCRNYNPHFRQLIHVGYKIAAEMGEHFLSALDTHQEIIAGKVKHNLLERHLKPLFL